MDFNNASIGDIISSFKRYIWDIIIGMCITGIIALLLSFFVITPTYSSFVDIYVNSTDRTAEDQTIDFNEINAAQKLVNTYKVILQTSDTLEKVIDKADVDFSYEELNDMISLSTVNNTEVLRVTVKADDAQTAYELSQAFALVAPEVITDIIEGGSVKIVSTPRLNPKPVSPNKAKNAVLGMMIGFLLTVVLCIFRMLLSDKNRLLSDEFQMAELCDSTVLSVIPDFTAGSKKNAKSAAGKFILNENSPQDITEAYDRLRFNLSFALNAAQSKTVIVTSAAPDEYKSTTSVNTAIAFAQKGSHVLLIDADMRNSTVHKIIGTDNDLGLSTILTGMSSPYESVFEDVIDNIDFVSAGPTPASPAEMLESAKMRSFLRMCEKEYDVIIIDTPPIGIVQDAAAFAATNSGYLIVARADYTQIPQLRMAVKKMESINCRIFGGILTGNTHDSNKYSYYKKYGKY